MHRIPLKRQIDIAALCNLAIFSDIQSFINVINRYASVCVFTGQT